MSNFEAYWMFIGYVYRNGERFKGYAPKHAVFEMMNEEVEC